MSKANTLFQTEGGSASTAGGRLTVRNPLLLSAVVLAGANSPQATRPPGLSTGDDSYMTAEEVVNLDLRNSELVVLSACETEGSVGGGEGVYSLQRAFRLAGARSVIASLWKVDDDATRALMVEFYENLWEEKMGKTRALCQAQLTVMRHYDPRTGTLHPRGIVAGGATTAEAEQSSSPTPLFLGRFHAEW